jgi:L-asparaginase/Glu-tRNA(Gln) amidotransferase subunit D
MGYLGEVGVNFKICWSRVLRHNFEGKLKVFTDMNQDISIVNITPCLNLKVIQAILMNSSAVIIQAYGMGNIPSGNPRLL